VRDDHAIPIVILKTGGTTIAPATMAWIRAVELEHTVDGADTLTLECDGFDSVEMQYRLLDDVGLFPGNQIELLAGYGSPDVGAPDIISKGLFDLQLRDPIYQREGVQLTLAAYDGLRRMMDGKQARVYWDFARDSDVVRKLARDVYGFEVGEMPAPSSPLANAPMNARSRDDNCAVQDTPTYKKMFGQKLMDAVKSVGETDLAWVKSMAEGHGWAYPKVRYINGKEHFVFRPAATHYDDFSQTFWYRKPGSGDRGDLLTYHPTWNTADAPTGIELMGWDKDAREPFRVRALMTQAGPKVTLSADQRLSEKIDPDIKSGGALRLSILGSGSETVTLEKTSMGGKTWNPLKEVPDVLDTSLLHNLDISSREAVMDYARAWLLTRQAAWWTFEASLQNQPGIHQIDTDQVHEFRGMAEMDEGPGIILRAVHRWEFQGNIHTVDIDGQKLIDLDAIPVSVTEEAA